MEPDVAICWHAARVEDVVADLATVPEGLTFAEASRRLARFGPKPDRAQHSMACARRRARSRCANEGGSARHQSAVRRGRSPRAGIATGTVDVPDEAALSGLTLIGFLGLTDPPAPGVKETLERLSAAGLRTIMLTGDQQLTAQAVGRELGLLTDTAQVIDVRELDAMSDDVLASRLATAAAFSRIAPEHKLRIVKALQSRGEIVAMLGDGVNDAPALKKADVGVAMGSRGTDVAKEAAAVVLQNDRFETIAAAVEEGRVIFDNIRKFVFYLFSCNVAEVFVLLAAGLFSLPIPLLPLQILWLNMVTDTIPALALAMEPGDADVMRRPPRDPQEAILSRAFLGGILGYASVITAATLAAFTWGLGTSHAKGMTMSFMTLALAQILHLGNARSDEHVLNPCVPAPICSPSPPC